MAPRPPLNPQVALLCQVTRASMVSAAMVPLPFSLTPVRAQLSQTRPETKASTTAQKPKQIVEYRFNLFWLSFQ